MAGAAAATTTYDHSALHPAAVTSATTTTGTTTGTNEFEYDAAGRMVSRTIDGVETSLTWDVTSSLTETTTVDGAHTVYAYDVSGQRVLQATVASGTHAGTATAYTPAGQVDDPNTAVTSTGDVTGTRYYTFGGATVAVRTHDGNLALVLGDEQGSVSVTMPVTLNLDGTMASATIADAQAVTRTSYTPYGQLRSDGDEEDDNLALDRGWLGQVEDRADATTGTGTGLTYLNARYYDPVLARFITPDPLMNPADPATLDPYRYADNNPVVFTDASGLSAACSGVSGTAHSACMKAYNAGSGYKAPRPTFQQTPQAWASRALHFGKGVLNVLSPITNAPSVFQQAKSALTDPQEHFNNGVEAYRQGFADMGQACKSGWAALTGKGSWGAWWHDATHQPGALYVGEDWDAGDYDAVFEKGGIGTGIVAQSVALGVAGGASGGGATAQTTSMSGPRFVANATGVIIDTHSPALMSQIKAVAASLASTGRPPLSTIYQGGLKVGGKLVQGLYGNKGGQLPSQPLGYYTESGVWPGAPGTERIVIGQQPGEVWYSPDHYGTFREVG